VVAAGVERRYRLAAAAANAIGSTVQQAAVAPLIQLVQSVGEVEALGVLARAEPPVPVAQAGSPSSPPRSPLLAAARAGADRCAIDPGRREASGSVGAHHQPLAALPSAGLVLPGGKAVTAWRGQKTEQLKAQ
jgi:hypothetical protein